MLLFCYNLETKIPKIKIYDDNINNWEFKKLQPPNTGSVLKLLITMKPEANSDKTVNNISKQLNSKEYSKLFEQVSIRSNNDKKISILILCKPEISIWARGIKGNQINLHLIKQTHFAHYKRTILT